MEWTYLCIMAVLVDSKVYLTGRSYLKWAFSQCLISTIKNAVENFSYSLFFCFTRILVYLRDFSYFFMSKLT